MNRKTLAISGIVAGLVAAVVNLAVEFGLNHQLVAADYIASVTVGVLTALAIIVLFRGRSTRCG
jgi:hypothetical protein